MSKRKTQIELAIETLESDLTHLRRDYEARRFGIEAAISALRQQAAKPARTHTAKPVQTQAADTPSLDRKLAATGRQ